MVTSKASVLLSPLVRTTLIVSRENHCEVSIRTSTPSSISLAVCRIALSTASARPSARPSAYRLALYRSARIIMTSDIAAIPAVHVAAANPTCPVPMIISTTVSHTSSVVRRSVSYHIRNTTPDTTNKLNSSRYGSSGGKPHIGRLLFLMQAIIPVQAARQPLGAGCQRDRRSARRFVGSTPLFARRRPSGRWAGRG